MNGSSNHGTEISEVFRDEVSDGSWEGVLDSSEGWIWARGWASIIGIRAVVVWGWMKGIICVEVRGWVSWVVWVSEVCLVVWLSSEVLEVFASVVMGLGVGFGSCIFSPSR